MPNAYQKENKIRENDYQDGHKNEQTVINCLRKKFDTVSTRDRYDPFDLTIQDTHLAEIKKRTVSKNTYPDTILPYSKIKEYKKVKKNYDDLILIFCFTDGDFYITYKQLVSLQKKDKRIHIDYFTRYTGFQHKKRLHLFIPTDILFPLSDLTLT